MSARDSVTLPPAFHVVPGTVVTTLLESDPNAVFDAVATGYRLHCEGSSINPDSYFLRFADKPRDRIIALPAYLGGDIDLAGIKWISSFPGNRTAGLDRASAILVLNDYATGYPVACLEGAAISATRTACLATQAAEALGSARSGTLALIGTGRIARATLAWLLHRKWSFESVRLFDLDVEAAARCAEWIRGTLGCPVHIAGDATTAMAPSTLVVLATTAGEPHLDDARAFAANPTVLHLSLRDISTARILESQNIVDDVHHSLKAHTSLHRAELEVGTHAFVAGTLQDIIAGRIAPDPTRPRLFSPFGLGILDIALGAMIWRRAVERGLAIEIPGFFVPAAFD
jgi:N-[(2S)-2-amino-2-carboxyethyl]-L-glutamate dehydrogenase